MTIGVLVVMLLPLAAAMPSDAVPVGDVPMAITRPLGVLTIGLPGAGSQAGTQPEPGLIVVGTGLLALASVLRRTTGV